MHKSTDHERETELYEVLLFCITTVQQDLHNSLKSAYYTEADEEGWAYGIQKTGILALAAKRSTECLAVKLCSVIFPDNRSPLTSYNLEPPSTA